MPKSRLCSPRLQVMKVHICAEKTLSLSKGGFPTSTRPHLIRHPVEDPDKSGRREAPRPTWGPHPQYHIRDER